MTIEVLAERSCSRRGIARQLGVDEKTVRYRLAQRDRTQPDGRADKPFAADAMATPIEAWVADAQVRGAGLNLMELYEHLVAEHGYAGSYKSVQRYVRAKYPRPKLRTRRRIETPPGAQAQADWAEFRDVRIASELWVLYAFCLLLSHSRMRAVIWSLCKDQLAWHHVHNEALGRLGGVPAVIRVDNEKTAVERGAGAWGVINGSYRTYARAARFHVDASRPCSPRDKGKVERSIRDQRSIGDPYGRDWRSLAELQRWTDERIETRARRRICPATGETIWESFQKEKPLLKALPLLPEPFDLVQSRRVGIDSTVHFEGRTYAVRFRHADRVVEVRGCARVVQVWSEGEIVAQHARHTRERILIDPTHYEGPDDDRVCAPVPLGRMGQRLAELMAMAPERRPIDQYAALAEAERVKPDETGNA